MVPFRGNPANTLNNVAAIHLETKHYSDAQTELEQALSINRVRWNSNPDMAGDDLARSLLMDSHLRELAGQPSATLCPLLREAESAAYSQTLKNAAAQEFAATCSTH